MARIFYKRHRFPPTVIQHAVWLYVRFTLSLHDVEEMLAHRGVEASYETVRAWTVKFNPHSAMTSLPSPQAMRYRAIDATASLDLAARPNCRREPGLAPPRQTRLPRTAACPSSRR